MITEKEYRADPALNYSKLSKYKDGQDFALQPVEPKSVFEIGKAFELAVKDRAKGTDKYHDRYFDCRLKGEIPKKLVPLMEESNELNDYLDVEAYLNNAYTYKTDPKGVVTRNNTYKNLHAWLDECLKNPGKVPIGIKDCDMIGRMVNSLFKVEVKLEGTDATPLSEILPHCEFQVPVFWEDAGIKKKALVDVMLELDDYIYVWDLKSAANFGMFKRFLRHKYWIQYMHYTLGTQKIYQLSSQRVKPMGFLVASKDPSELHMAKEFSIDMTNFEELKDKYLTLCIQYKQWEKAGKPGKGWLNPEIITLYP